MHEEDARGGGVCACNLTPRSQRAREKSGKDMEMKPVPTGRPGVRLVDEQGVGAVIVP